MSDREEFEKGSMIGCALETPLSANDAKILHEFLAAARQPEIDSLNKEVSRLVNLSLNDANRINDARLKNKWLEKENAALKAENERLREAADRAEGFLFAVSLMPQLGPKVRDVALKHHEALRAAMKEAK